MINRLITELVSYGNRAGLVADEDQVYVTNQLLELFDVIEYEPAEVHEKRELVEILEDLLDYAWEQRILKENTVTMRDLYDTKIMGKLTPAPSVVRRQFADLYSMDPKLATNFYYKFSQATNYIRKDRIAKDEKWVTETEYGRIDITINLSKPEKDPREIAKAGQAKKSGYPSCLLCVENEGYAGHYSHPARQNHRLIPIQLDGEDYFLQYSPYVYYNEHCIVFNGEHTPMKIDRAAFIKLFDFVKQFPHYFLGSNADLPIVGGSILSHDHFQGGNYTFAMAKAQIEHPFTIPGYEDVESGIVKWPLSVLRIRHRDEKRLIDLADHVLAVWRDYTDEDAFIFAHTDGEPHNTITPIARKVGGTYELDLTLRNNITTEEHPLGVYHPHAKLHHIKKENIGLIEVMGLAVLPSRLKDEMALLKEAILAGRDIASDETLEKHADWVAAFLPRYDHVTEENIEEILQQEIGKVFVQVLEDAGVYKHTEEGRNAFLRFLKTL